MYLQYTPWGYIIAIKEANPEDRAGSAEADRRRNTDDVAGTDSGCSGYHQGAKGRNVAFLVGLLHDHAAGFTEKADLDKPETPGEIGTRDQQEERYAPGLIQNARNGIDDRIDGIDHINMVSLDRISLIVQAFCTEGNTNHRSGHKSD